MNSSATCSSPDVVSSPSKNSHQGDYLLGAFCIAGAGVWMCLFDYFLTARLGSSSASVGAEALKWVNAVGTMGVVLSLALRFNRARRKRASILVPLRNDRYELVARAATDAVFDWDLKTQNLWWGAGLNNLFGYPREDSETNADGWSGRVHPEDCEKVKAGVQRITQAGGNAWGDEFRLLRKEGGPALVMARGFVIRDASGQPLRLLGGLHDITARRECEDKLRRSRQQLRALSARLESLREEERKRIARELHDTLGQMLTGLKMDLRWIERKLSKEREDYSLNPTLDKVIEAGELTDAAIETVQKIATDLRPGVLDNLGLATAIKHEAQRTQERTGILWRLQLPDQMPEISPRTTVGLFRILQEALTNVTRHAQATQLEIRLWQEKDDLFLQVSDNGIGISSEALSNPKSLGLLGMNERVALLGGEIKIERGESQGTVVTVRVPFNESQTEVWDLP